MKPLKLTDEKKNELIQEFANMLNSKKAIAGGTVIFDVGSQKAKKKQIIAYSSDAWVKMQHLLDSYSSEVAWHCLCEKVDDGTYLVEDIIVYPQIVTGVTVDTDDEAYTNFLINLPIEQAQKMHMQCHSHVDMGVTPSGTDLTNQREIIEGSSQKGFYIFQIWNKRMQCYSVIYDFEAEIMYENSDIEIAVLLNEGFWADEWAEDTHKVVSEKQKKTVQYTNHYQERMLYDGLE